MGSAKVTFWGAAREVTGSMHLVETGRHRILLDCGLFMGASRYAQDRNRRFPFVPQEIDAVLISHAHIDHCGNLPHLVKQGFQGPIFCTPATRMLMGIMLNDSARIQQEEADFAAWLGKDESSAGGLYTAREVDWALEQCQEVAYDEDTEIVAGVTARFLDAGHLLGSAMIHLSFVGGSSLCYTGDLGRSVLEFLRPPSEIPPSDVILCESTYGGRTHAPMREMQTLLRDVVARTAARQGKVLIPAFSLGRAQIVVHYMQQWMAQGLIPRLPIYVDSPLASDIAQAYRHFPDCLSRTAINPAAAEAQYIRKHADSRELSRTPGACILVASGGMCEAGRILNHLEANLDDPRNTVVLVSYQSPGSLGKKLLERGPTVRIRGKNVNKWADVVDLNGFSGHADQRDLVGMLKPHADSRIFLVHGDPVQSLALADALEEESVLDVTIPQREDEANW